MRFLLLAAFSARAALAGLSGGAASVPPGDALLWGEGANAGSTGVAGSLVAVAPYGDAFPFSSEEIVTAMNTTVLKMPGTLPGQAYLESDKRKLSAAEAGARLADFGEFWQEAHPDVSMDDFQAWAQPLYRAFLSQFHLVGKRHFKHKMQSKLRSLLFGLSVVGLQVNGGTLNHFSVLDPKEAVYFTGLAARGPAQEDGRRRRLEAPLMSEDEVRRVLASLPTSYDMRDSGKMPPIRDQMQCGSCWAFTASSTLELQNIFQNGNPDSSELSEQELVSCNTVGTYKNSGCNGGWPEYANYFIADNGGLPTAATYPYIKYTTSSVTTPACQTAKMKPQVVTSAPTTVYLPSPSPTSPTATVLAVETAIMQQIYNGVPVTVSVAASSNCWQSYGSSGAMMTCNCGTTVDHVVLAVGWTAQYFVLRNQWGTSWGVNGYAYLPRPSSNPTMPKKGNCAFLGQPSYVQQVIQVDGKTSAPVTSSAPVTTNEPTPQPTTTHAPVTTGAPVTTNAPVTQAPVTPQPTTTKAPVTTAKPNSVTAKPVTSKKPTHMPTHKPTARPNSGTACTQNNPLRCSITGLPQFCCPWLCFFDPYYGQNVCTNYVCCTNGKCANVKFDSSGNPIVYCPSSKGGRALLDFLQTEDAAADRLEGVDEVTHGETDV